MSKATIEMPNSCADCPCNDDEYSVCRLDKDYRYNARFVFNREKPNWCPLQPLEMALQVVDKYYPKETEIDWRKEFEDMVRYIGVIDYGKERWFMETEKDGRVRWYDRYDGEYLTTDELQQRIYEVVRKLDD